MTIDMKKRKITIIITIIGILFIILVSTFMYVINYNKEKEYNLVVNNIIKKAKECVDNNDCQRGNIKLANLKEKEYIKDIINPKTKKEFSNNTYVSYPNYELILID